MSSGQARRAQPTPIPGQFHSVPLPFLLPKTLLALIVSIYTIFCITLKIYDTAPP